MIRTPSIYVQYLALDTHMGIKMDRKKYNKTIYIIITLNIIFLAAFPVIIFIITKNLPAAAISGTGMLLLCILSYALYRTDDKYISGIVIQLSELMDVLLYVNDKEIFPDNEDTVLSKLQNKVIKLSKILKNRSIHEEQEHENIKKLVSDISHQLKTPIANLKMYSSFLADTKLPPEQKQEYIDVICLSVDRLNFLSENIIKVSRLESGIIQDKIELKHDRNWTAEAIFNLLDNAVKYGNAGNTIYMSVRRLGMFAEISVRDENNIIPYEERNNIFMRFYRGENSSRQEGLGVGLYLAREIVVKQGGYINLRTSGSGNIFSIMLYIETTGTS